MSDYLTNLARRSAGMASVVRARTALPAVVTDRAFDATVEVRVDRALPTVPVADRAERSASAEVQLSSDVGVAPAVLLGTPIAVAAPLSVGLQRAPMLAAATPAPSVVAIATPMPATGSERTQSLVARGDESTQRNAPPMPLRAPQQTVAAERIERSVETALTPVAPIVVPRIDTEAAANPERQPRPDDAREREPSVNPRTASAQLTEPTNSVAVAIEPAVRTERTVPQPVVRDERARAPERTVHVRIGAIEITGGSATLSAPLAQQTPASAVAHAAPSLSGGFDDFASIRSYAPWSW